MVSFTDASGIFKMMWRIDSYNEDFHPITFSYVDQAQPKNPFLNQFQYQSSIVTIAQHFVLQTEKNVEIV